MQDAKQTGDARRLRPPVEIKEASSRLTVLERAAAEFGAALDDLFELSGIEGERPVDDYGNSLLRWRPLDREGLRRQGRARKMLGRWLELGFSTLGTLAPERQAQFGTDGNFLRASVIRQEPQQAPVNAELDACLGAARHALDRQLDLIRTLPEAHDPPETLVLPDTNALLAEPTIESWLLGDDPVSIVIVPDVVRELDKKKLEPALRDKAHAIIGRFKEYGRRGDTLEGVKLAGSKRFVEVAEPPDFTAVAGWLDAANSDDRILASALNLAARRLTAPVVLITRDRNLQNKARRCALPAVDVADLIDPSARKKGAARAADTDVELRKSALLVIEELQYSRGLIASSLDRKAYWDTSQRQLPATVWEHRREALAASVPASVWRLAADAYSCIDALNWSARDAQASDAAEARRVTHDLDEPSEIEEALTYLETSVDEGALREALAAIDVATSGLTALVE